MLSSNATSLEVDGVSKRFGGIQALSNINASLQGPGIVGIIGPNGSGKSTLLGLMSGFVRPTSGQVRVGGVVVSGASPAIGCRMGLARTFQQIRLVPNLRAWENIAMGVRHLLLPEQRIRALVYEVAVRLDLADFLQSWPHDLPAGHQRKIQLASVLISKPSVLLLDEPAAGLTEMEASHLVDVIRSAGAESLVVVVEHNMQVIYGSATRVLVLLEGVLRADAPPALIKDDPLVRQAYLGVG